MITAEIEIYDCEILLFISADELTNEINERLIADGWHLSTNGFIKNEIWCNVYAKHI